MPFSFPCFASFRGFPRLFARTQCQSATGSGIRSFAHDYRFLDDIWSPQEQPGGPHSRAWRRYDLIVLNCPSDLELARLCESARDVYCADGGANTLYRLDRDIVPRAIVGDMDSVEHSVAQYYASQGADVVARPSQDENDFYKTLDHALECRESPCHIVAWGAFGERFDHEMQAFNVLKRFALRDRVSSQDSPDAVIDSAGNSVGLILMSSKSFSIILAPGKHFIAPAMLQGKICGVIPLYGDAVVSTRGLHWDMSQDVVSFGGLVSSSNEIDDYESLEIETNEWIVFYTTCELKGGKRTRWQW